MGNPIFKFTLSRVQPQTLRGKYPLSGWTNEGVALTTAWTTGEFPSVSLVDGGTSDRLRKTSISDVASGDHVLRYSITSNKTANHKARIRFEKAGVGVSQMLPDTHGLDPIEISLTNGTVVGTVNIRLSDVPDEVWVQIIDAGGGGASVTTVNYLDMDITARTLTQVISEPDGWKEAQLKLVRDEKFHSLVEGFEGQFIFYGQNGVDNGGADFIKTAEQQDGASAEIGMLIQADIDGDGVYEEEVFDGLLDLTGLKEVFDNKIRVPIVPADLWSKFMARKGVEVNLRSTTTMDGEVIDAADIVDIDLISQKIKKQFDGHLLDTRTFDETDLATTDYIQLDVDTYVLDEIEKKYTLPIIDNPEIPQSLIDVEEDGSYEFDLRVEASIVYYDVTGTYPNTCDVERSVVGSAAYMDVYIKINNETAVQFTETSSPLVLENVSTIYTYTGTLSLRKGDQIKIYGDMVGNISDLGDAGATLWIHSVNGVGQVNVPISVADPGAEVCTFLPPDNPSNLSIAAPSGQVKPTYFRITAHTTYPNTSAQGFLIHDAAYAIIRRICGEFRSEYLGSTLTREVQYTSNGCAWKNIILQGLQLRGYDIGDKQFSMSFEKLWDCIHPLFFLGLGYGVYNGIDCIIIDHLASFFDASDISVNLSNIRQISREYDVSKLYNQVETGFVKWQSEATAGIDDPQTKRSWSLSPAKHDQLLRVFSEAITASIAIESTRRKTIEKSEDYKYDNEPFIIAIDDTTVSPDRFLPELDENFSSITGLENSDFRYNLIHTPLRILLRWAKWWNGCLQKVQNSVVRFTSGEGNYAMESDYNCSGGDPCLAVLCDNLSESADINLSTYGQNFGFLHLPLLYTIEVINFTWDEYLAIRNNRDLAIGISQTLDNYRRFFIKELTYDICKGKARIVAWPYDETPIDVVDTEMPDRVEIPDPESSDYDVDYQAILDYADLQGWATPSDAEKQIQSDKLASMKTEGIWDDLDLFYYFEGDGSEDFKRINWKSPGDFTLTKTGTVTFDEDGATGDGSTGYLDTGWAPDPDAVHFTQDEGGVFCKINNDPTTGSKSAYGCYNFAGLTLLRPKNGTDQHQFGVNSSLQFIGTSVTANGFYHTRRVSTNDMRLFKDGSQVGATSTNVSNAMPTVSIIILAENGGGTAVRYGDYQIGVFGIGASMTGKESALNTIFNS